MAEIWRLSASELAGKIRGREISAREAAQSALDRLEAVNPAINAVVEYRPEQVLAQADAIDTRIARGEDPGVLAGVPVTTKVLTDQAAFATTNGTVLQKEQTAQSNNPVVDNLLRAGAVLLGRTNTPAFSLRWFTSNLLHGATVNPRNPAITPGGSSGGAAAAVTAGIGHIAQGTDIAGSIRYPAYACGVHGLRPGLGRVPGHNATGVERSIGQQLTAVAGPIARTVADLRLGLAAMSGYDARDPWSVAAPLEGPPYTRRAAFIRRPAGMEIAPEVEAALLDGVARLQAAGWQVQELSDLPGISEAANLQARLWMGDSFAPWDDLIARDGDPGAAAVIAGMKSLLGELSAVATGRALVRRTTILREFLLLLETYPLILLPVSGELPFPSDLDKADFQRVWRAQLLQVGLPLLGLPCLSVATGLAGASPVGVQLLSARFREDICLAAAEAIEMRGTPPAPIDPEAEGF